MFFFSQSGDAFKRPASRRRDSVPQLRNITKAEHGREYAALSLVIYPSDTQPSSLRVVKFAERGLMPGS